VPMFEAKREEFRPMALTSSVPQAQTKAIRQEASLYIVKPSFERNLKWDVVYQGIRIPVAMSDESFLTRIDRGERFAKGDTLEVDLQIDQVLDPNINTSINKGYQIIKVNAHAPGAEQSQLNFEGSQDDENLGAEVAEVVAPSPPVRLEEGARDAAPSAGRGVGVGDSKEHTTESLPEPAIGDKEI
jgi:hypothetical protein